MFDIHFVSQIHLNRGINFEPSLYTLLNDVARKLLVTAYSNSILCTLRHLMIFGSREEENINIPTGIDSEQKFANLRATMLVSLKEVLTNFSHFCRMKITFRHSENEFRIRQGGIRHPVAVLELRTSAQVEFFHDPSLFFVLSFSESGSILLRMRTKYDWPRGSSKPLSRVQQFTNYFCCGDSCFQQISGSPRVHVYVEYDDAEKEVSDGQSPAIKVYIQEKQFSFSQDDWFGAGEKFNKLLSDLDFYEFDITDVLKHFLGDQFAGSSGLCLKTSASSRFDNEKNSDLLVNGFLDIISSLLDRNDEKKPTSIKESVSWHVIDGLICNYSSDFFGDLSIASSGSTVTITLLPADSWLEFLCVREDRLQLCKTAVVKGRLACMIRKKAMVSMLSLRENLLHLQQEKQIQGKLILSVSIIPALTSFPVSQMIYVRR